MAVYLEDSSVAGAYIADLFRLVGEGALQVPIHGEYDFTPEGVRAAQEVLEAGQTAGKLLIKIA